MISATETGPPNDGSRVPGPSKPLMICSGHDSVQALRTTAEHTTARTPGKRCTPDAQWCSRRPRRRKYRSVHSRSRAVARSVRSSPRALPDGAATEAQLTDAWIAAAKRRWRRAVPDAAEALRHALGLIGSGSTLAAPIAFIRAAPWRTRIEQWGRRSRAPGRRARDRDHADRPGAAAKVRHFKTYNRTAAARRVEEVVMARERDPARPSSPTATPRWRRCRHSRSVRCLWQSSTSGASRPPAILATWIGCTSWTAPRGIYRPRHRSRGKSRRPQCGDRSLSKASRSQSRSATLPEIAGRSR